MGEFVLVTYNPRGITPFHCFVSADGVIASRGPVGAGDWQRLRGTWEGRSMRAAMRQTA